MSNPQSAAAKDSQFRRLLPAHARPPPSTTPALSQPRLNSVLAACNACRKYKAKCSADRPSCRRCLQRRILCQYVTRPGETRTQALSRNRHDLRDQSKMHEEVIGLLKNLPDRDAQDILQRIRSGSDLGSILNHVKAGNLLLQMSVTPETRFRYEFPYKSEMPKEYCFDNPYLKSFIYEAASLYDGDQTSDFSDDTNTGHVTHLGPEEVKSLYLAPFHAAQVIDPLLFDAKISSWTHVCDDDVLMRDLLGVLFRCEYQFTAAIHKDLFLEDLTAGRKDFSSSLLVNVLLAYACVCYPRFPNRVEYWNPNNLVYRFIAEAKRLWELEATVARITTIQAGILFAVFHNLCGLDEIGQPYRVQAISLAHKLRIFDSVGEGESQRMHRGKQYTAWALYNWESLSAFSFMFAPLIKKPPKWPLPDPSEDMEWYSEVWVKYPLMESYSPSYFGLVFRARSQFRIIMNEFCEAAHTEGSKITLDQAHGFRERLQHWYNNLPNPLKPKRIVLPGHLQIHIYYHHLLLTIFEPLLDIPSPGKPSPQRVVADAKKHLQTLVRLYYLRHGFEAMDLFIVIPLMLTGYDCLDAIKDAKSEEEIESLRSTVILIAHGLYNQRKNHYLAQALFRVICGRMRPEEVSMLKKTLSLDHGEVDAEQELVVAIRSHWPVSVVKKREDMDSHILTKLVESYSCMNVEE